MASVGSVVEAKTKFLKRMYVYKSVRKPGYVYHFTLRRDDYYRCAECKKFGKMRTVVIRDGTIVPGAKHPEDDHHMDCQPFLETGKIPYR